MAWRGQQSTSPSRSRDGTSGHASDTLASGRWCRRCASGTSQMAFRLGRYSPKRAGPHGTALTQTSARHQPPIPWTMTIAWRTSLDISFVCAPPQRRIAAPPKREATHRCRRVRCDRAADSTAVAVLDIGTYGESLLGLVSEVIWRGRSDDGLRGSAGKSGLYQRRPFAEPWPDVARSQERENGSTTVETTGDRSVRALRRVHGPGGNMIDRPTEDVFASVTDADNDPESP